MIFPGFNPPVPEGADFFSGVAWDPNAPNCNSKTLSIIGDTSAMTVPGGGGFTVLGGNKSANQADMVPINDEYGSSGMRPLNSPFEKKYWPYQYIGILYTNSGGTGTVQMLMQTSNTEVKLV